MTDTNVLVATVRTDRSTLYEEGLEAIEQLERGESVDEHDQVTFPSASALAETFNERTYELLETVREDEPASIRETARLVDRDVKNVHEELTRLAGVGVIRLEDDGRAKRPIVPYDELVIVPFAQSDDSTSVAAP